MSLRVHDWPSGGLSMVCRWSVDGLLMVVNLRWSADAQGRHSGQSVLVQNDPRSGVIATAEHARRS